MLHSYCVDKTNIVEIGRQTDRIFGRTTESRLILNWELKNYFATNFGEEEFYIPSESTAEKINGNIILDIFHQLTVNERERKAHL